MADDLRAQLIETMRNAPYDHEDQADALLPVVRAFAALQLREAAVNHRAMGLVTAEDLIARAEEIERGDRG